MPNTPVNIDKDYLYEEYVVKRRSLSEIGRDLGVCPGTVMNYMKKYGIPRRTPGDALAFDLSNQTIGHWKVLNKRDGNKRTHARWQCICLKCDQVYWVLAHSLYSGVSKQCMSCRRIEQRKGYQELNATYWKSIIQAAEIRNLPFEITIEYAWDLFQQQNGICAISGIPIVFGYKQENTASLDRIDSKLGYIAGNVQWVHKDVNRMKWAYHEEYFIYLCTLIAEHSGHRAENTMIVDNN